jgi:hypothetical protein
MISKQTTKDIIKRLNRWAAEHDIDKKLIHYLLFELSTVSGNESFAKSMDALANAFDSQTHRGAK